jgi:sec-independent protein translocase protein TatA
MHMGSIGFSELLVILLIILIVFGAGKLPQVGDALGRGIRNFRKASKGEDEQPATKDVSDESSSAPKS